MASATIVQLDTAFRTRGMTEHVRLLATGRLAPALVREWLRLLRIPPHHDDYPVLPRGIACPRCGSWSENRMATGTFVPFSWPRGWAERCCGCHFTWLHEERL